MKTLKITFVFTLLFSCVCSLTAQVIESVAYTPTKSGNYSNITTRSLAVFEGDVNADTITGLGDKFTLDTKGYTPGAVGSNRDVYSAVTAVPTGEAFISGMINTVNNTSITLLKASSGTVYGGDVNFANSPIAINQAGEMEIHDVTMKNPKCNVRWVSLPAYTQDHDYDTEANPTPQYYKFAYCDPSAGDDDGSTSSGWETNVRTAKLLGTCTDGWDGGVNLEGSSGATSEHPCTYTAGHLSGSFTCSAYSIKECEGSIYISYPTEYTKGCAQRDSSYYTTTYKGETPEWNNTKKCHSASTTFYPHALSVYSKNLSRNDQFIISTEMPQIFRWGDNCQNTNSNTFRYRLWDQWFELFCGYHGSSGGTAGDSKHNIQAKLANKSCNGQVTNYKYCEDLYGSGYEVGGINALADEQICQKIKDNNPSGINVNDFTCIKRGLPRNGYTAARARNCNNHHTVEFEHCKVTHCNKTQCPNIHSSTNYEYRTMTTVKDNFFGFEDPFAFIDCSVDGNIPATQKTIYFEQTDDAELLSCKLEN